MARKIPATVVTGFLGAGKTTLIRHLLDTANGKRIALVINEFGDLGIDGDILRGCGIEGCSDDDLVELSNGCICCTVAEDFIPAMEKLINRDDPPDHIVIETSGLALPQPLVRAFNWPDIRTSVTVDGVVAVVDGPAVAAGQFAADTDALDAQRAADDGLDHETPLSELFEDQLACADMVVVNKSDLLGGVAGTLARDLKAKLRAGVPVLPAEMGRLDPGILLGLGVDAQDDMNARHEHHHHSHSHDNAHGHDHGHDHDHAHDHDHGHDHDHDHVHDHDHDHDHDHGHGEFESFVIDLPQVENPTTLIDAVSAAIASQGLLRVKGFVAVAGKPMRQVLQAVGPRIDTYFDRAFGPDEPRETRLVVIGPAGLDRGLVAELFARAA